MCLSPSTTPSPSAASPRVAMVVEQMYQPVPGGSGTYITELAQAALARGARIAGLTAHHGDSLDPADVGLPAAMPLRSSRLPRLALYESWNHGGYPRAEALLPGSEVVHATTWAIPGTTLPLAVTVHDLAFLRSPEHFTRRGNAYFRRCLARTIAHADAVIAPSRATADDCVDAGIAAERIEVIPHGVRPRTVSSAHVESFRQTYGLTRPYLLWTGTREPRKNLRGLLAAFELAAPHLPDLDLVLVGPAGWGEDSNQQPVPEALRARVHVLGRLSDDDLAGAYRGARAFAFPSHWEGFGLPVLEAMAYGAPVVTSRGTCMEEVVGDAGLLADPSSPEDIAAQLVLAAGSAHDELVEAGRVQAARFTWEASAASHLALYEEIAR